MIQLIDYFGRYNFEDKAMKNEGLKSSALSQIYQFYNPFFGEYKIHRLLEKDTGTPGHQLEKDTGFFLFLSCLPILFLRKPGVFFQSVSRCPGVFFY